MQQLELLWIASQSVNWHTTLEKYLAAYAKIERDHIL